MARRTLVLALHIVLFAITSVVSMFVLFILAEMAMPGRGFLPSVRHYYTLDLHLSADRGWTVVRSISGDQPEWQAPSEGFRVWVQESSMGRWHPAKMGAWRARNWTIDNWAGEPKPDLEDPNNELARAVRDHIQNQLIPKSTLWELWPPSDDRTAKFVGSKGTFWWSAWSSSEFSGNAPLVVGAGIAIGLVVAIRVSIPARRSPRDR